jgi:hypothetical protein
VKPGSAESARSAKFYLRHTAASSIPGQVRNATSNPSILDTPLAGAGVTASDSGSQMQLPASERHANWWRL